MSARLSTPPPSSARAVVRGAERRELRLADPGRREGAGRLEDRVGDAADVRVDPLEVADQVEVERARLDALRGVLAQAGDVVGGVLVLEVAEVRLLLEQPL